ncbi:MAG: DUF2274 domain-containing protein [Desulfobulbus sp.]|nr:DUF2274 domain-containing protein [Desulfobulbus sp.]
MSLKIKPAPEPPPMTRLSVKIPVPTATMLAAYVKAYEQSYNKPTDGGFIVNEILLTFFNSDREFQDLLKKNPDLLTAVAEKPVQQNKPTSPEGL